MSRHQYDLIQCMKQPGKSLGLVCSQCDGKCPICDSFVKPSAKVYICHDCSLGHLYNKCILCSNYLGDNCELGVPANYCLECVRQEKHREGCPRIVNIGSSKSDMIFQKKKEASKNTGGLLR
ncbi:Pre-mRNA-splicing factor RDS3 [Spathaspora sp. JA1]|nr:Pre-mRNA-splicing factor RDS3 [Spathaspora sp. JA1]